MLIEKGQHIDKDIVRFVENCLFTTLTLDGRKVSLKGFTSRKGGTFDAALVIDKDKGVAFDFGNNNKERKKK